MFLRLYRKISVYSKAIVLIIILLSISAPAQAVPEQAVPDLAATAAILIESNSGRIIFQKNADTPLPPASTSKIISAITALDLANLSEQHQISAEAAQVGESSINLQAGEILTIDDLLKASLIRSGNDACFALAEAVAGDESLFVHWLNLKAATLGATSATLYNSNGLPIEGHQISAKNLAFIASYAMKNNYFAEVVSSKYAQIGSGSSATQTKEVPTNYYGNLMLLQASKQALPMRLVLVWLHQCSPEKCNLSAWYCIVLTVMVRAWSC